MKVLIVDDNHNIAETIADYLELEGMTIDCAYHGEAALNLVKENHYDVIIMDIMMPKLDGINAVKKLREEQFCNTPILFLTAKDQLEDKIAAFKAGGDDYLLKPFAMEELCLRLYALSNRGPRQDIGELKFADITINTRTDEVKRAETEIKLSRIQLKILKLLMRQAPSIVSRQEVIESIWGDETPSSDALRSHIYGLRNALDKGFETSRLETIHGQGYRIKD
ncbi:TPA: response regulator transcription factor [Photobacterium damselae]|uniref:Response regulator MprA n=2 Tax=Photobacterium damselae TaxID=38293 RepID=A0A1Q9H4A3_PHODP|nr:response regulator transcription factor [Photobacterium damselae]EJN6958418.1 response regulator transcription factor [Photobacterium damselae]MBE8129527.1 response regulator transcription factor [Photobacterium damselae subsp. piscicida]MCG3844138.1 response regulator transcription factor [Photobacterium damselae]MCG9777985.1 response regulator transcription factor [Photobacterium damselae]MDP2515398.1 response regulator transcription factor [Photobacterium damselae subsp. piscicida]